MKCDTTGQKKIPRTTVMKRGEGGTKMPKKLLDRKVVVGKIIKKRNNNG
jgi:hypothetical protein